VKLSFGKGLVLGAVLLLGSAVPSAAQGTFGAGLSLLRIPDFDTLPGFVVDYTSPVSTMTNGTIGWVGDFSLNRNGEFEETILLFQGGVRFTGTSNAKFRPFGQFLLGLARDTCCDGFSTNELVVTPGGGVDIGLNEKAAVRAQIDFPIIMFEGDSETTNRFFFGVSWKVGQ
jgi:hypothetical protein